MVLKMQPDSVYQDIFDACNMSCDEVLDRISSELIKRPEERDILKELLRHAFNIAYAPSLNIARGEVWVGGSCYLLSDKLLAKLILDCVNLASSEKGSTGINISTYSKHQLKTLSLAINSSVDLINNNNKRKGAANLIVPIHSDAIPELAKECHSFNANNFTTLTLSVWLNNTFWKRYDEGKPFYLMDMSHPRVAELHTKWGSSYNEAYELCVKDPSIGKVEINIEDYLHILASNSIAGKSPMYMHSDNQAFTCPHRPMLIANKSGPATNLCCEINQYTGADLASICSLGSISLVVLYKSGAVDFQRLSNIVTVAQMTLSGLNMGSTYSNPLFAEAAKKLRANGLGVTGFADLMQLLGLPMSINGRPNPEVTRLNKMIFGCMYFNSILSSCRYKDDIGVAPLFDQTTFAEGKFKFDLLRELSDDRIKMGMKPIDEEILTPIDPSEWGQANIDSECTTWDQLRKLMVKGMANTTLMAIMPTSTSSTARNEGPMCEPHAGLMSSKSCFRGEVQIKWSNALEAFKSYASESYVTDYAARNRGSLSGFAKAYARDWNVSIFAKEIAELEQLEEVYKTVWEVSQSSLYWYAGIRNAYIDQGMSQNLWLSPDKEYFPIIVTALRYASDLGLGCLLYYLNVRKDNEEIITDSCAGGSCNV